MRLGYALADWHDLERGLTTAHIPARVQEAVLVDGGGARRREVPGRAARREAPAGQQRQRLLLQCETI